MVGELDADYFVFENVKGLTVGKQRQFLDELIAAFEDVGYDVLQPWRVLNAARYGVPQDRERLILMGAKKGRRLPSYPAEICTPAGASEKLGLLKAGPSCADALADLPDAESFRSLETKDEVRTSKWKEPSRYAAELRCAIRGAWHKGYKREWDPQLLTSSMRTTHTEISRRRFRETDPGKVEPVSRFFKLAASGVSNTLRAGTDSSRGAFTSPRPIHYAKNRCITVREMARLHGFPDWFRFHETKWHGARQIGNAVPPPLARAVATSVIEALDVRVTAPRKLVPLGNSALLRMDMGAAAAYWGVPALIGRRDKKSGNKKRKQIDIEAQRLSQLSRRKTVLQPQDAYA
jgi:DNA (cytosine-5)-methyltransferase 1